MPAQAEYPRETTSRIGPYRPARSLCLPPATRHAPGQFLPDRWLGWSLRLVAAMLATAALGVAMPRVNSLLAQTLLPEFAERALPLWLRLLAGAWYALLIVFMYFPFFLAVSGWFFKRGAERAANRTFSRWPSVSILIPAHNEEAIVLETIQSAIGQNYPDFEVIVIDDASTDRTSELAATTAARLIRHGTNRGKAAALNTGLGVARGEVIVTCDADSYFKPDAIRHLVAPLADPRNGGVAGRLRLLRPRGALHAFQAIEYGSTQVLVKAAQDAIGRSVLVAPGPVSAYRADVLRSVGGVPDHTLTEDVDLSWIVIRHGLRIAYEPRAVAYTDAPGTDAELRRQRHRWIRGGLQSLRKHRPMVGDRTLGLIGLFWMPIWLLGYLMKAASLLGTMATLLILWSSSAPTDLLAFLGLCTLVTVTIDAAMIITGVAVSDPKDLRFIPHLPMYVLYKAVRMTWFTIEACYLELRRAPRAWDGSAPILEGACDLDTVDWIAPADEAETVLWTEATDAPVLV